MDSLGLLALDSSLLQFNMTDHFTRNGDLAALTTSIKFAAVIDVRRLLNSVYIYNSWVIYNNIKRKCAQQCGAPVKMVKNT